MPVFERSTTIPRPSAELFEFLARPANLIQVMPPELNMRLVEGPERLFLGAQMVLQTRRWGFAQRIVSKITAFEPNRLFTDEQIEGPFKKWAHSHILEDTPDGTRMTDRIEFEAPGGMLGLVLTQDAIEGELEELFEYRTQKFEELFAAK
jgi:ligand-binding SRPBCC domain-containing protein